MLRTKYRHTCHVTHRQTQMNVGMGVIYERYRYPTFQDEKVENLLLPAVNRGDLRSN